MARILLAVVAALLLGAPAANATIVFTSDSWVYAADDDGTNVRKLFSSYDAGVNDVYEADVHPNGTTVSFTGVTRVHGQYTPPGPVLACGMHCYGIYTFAGNAFTRHSPEARACSGNPCASFSAHSAPASDGSVVGQYYFKAWDYQCNGNREWCSTAEGSQTLIRELAGGGDAQVLDTGCDYPGEPIPHPTDPSLVMFVGCSDYDHSPARHFVSTIDAQGAVTHLFFNHGGFQDAAWSADGSLIVTSERGQQPGLWITPADQPDTARWVLETTSEDVFLGSPRLAGDKILFVHQNDVWSVPADCHRCPLTEATKVTSDGEVSALGWTSKALTPYVRPTTGGDGGAGGGGGVTPTPSPSPSPTPAPGPAVEPPALDTGFAWAGKRSLRGLLRGRLAFELSCDCRAVAVLTLGRTVVARGTGRNGATLKPTKAGKRRLRRLGRAKLKLKVTAGGRSFTRAVTLRR